MLAVLQFDSPSLAVLDRMLDAGRLPALAGLRERGVWHELETPATHFAAGAFHTLYSGTELADHGLFYPFQWSAADQRVRYTTAFPAPPPVWERPGGRALAMDPYESRPPLTPPSGTVVSGWQFTDRVVLQPWSSPPGLNARLETLFGPPAAVEEVFGRSSPRDLLRLRRDLLASSGRAADAAALLLAESTYDLTWLTFSAGHVAGHQFFDLSQLDEADAATRRVLGGALEEIYQSVDAAFARVLAALPEGTDVIVTSPVGMDVNTSRADLLPEMLDAVLYGGIAARRGHRVRVRVEAAGRAADRAAGAGRVRAARQGGAGPDRAAGAARPGLDGDPRVRPARRQPGLRAAEPARPRARRDRRAGARPRR